MFGRPHQRSGSPTMQPELGDRQKPMNCWRAMAARGERWKKNSQRPSRGWARDCRGALKMTTQTMKTNREIRILADANGIAQTAAAEFLAAVRAAESVKDSFNVALAGGSTPKALYALLASDPSLQSKVPWSKIQFFFGDERHVPPDNAESNFRMTNEAMFSKAPIVPKQVHRIKAEKPDAAQAAEEYEKELRTSFKLQAGQLPRFDLV